MKKYINVLLTALVLGFGAVLTTNAQSSRDFRPDYDYYDDEFDWRWDVRVRISDGINSGLITRWEANRLYRKLENIEEKEYAYLADGFYEPWEQDEIWRDVQWLNSRVGLELRDFDRTYYGFTPIGIAFTGYPSWWYTGGYNFYRFDRWGWGSIQIGYAPRCFVPRWVPNRTVYVKNYRRYGHSYYRTGSRNKVVHYERYANSRNVTRSPRTTAGRNNGTIYNRNNSNARRGTAVTPNSRSRSSSVDRSAAVRRSATIGSRSATPDRSTARSRSYNSGNSESLNRANSSSSRSRAISRPSTSSSRVATPSRSRAGSSESINRSSRSSSSRSTPKSTYSRSSSSTSRSAVSRSSAGRTKVPESSRSSSRSGSRNNE